MNTTSMSGLIRDFSQTNYSFAKAGLYCFTKSVAMEPGHYGIRAHAICPNAYTRMTATLPTLLYLWNAVLIPPIRSPGQN